MARGENDIGAPSVSKPCLPPNRDQGLKTAWWLAWNIEHGQATRIKGGKMSRIGMLLLTIASSVVGLLAGGVLVFLVFFIMVLAVAGPISSGEPGSGGYVVIFFGPLAALLGAIMGAAAGAIIVQKALR
jgi:hypothetical protein